MTIKIEDIADTISEMKKNPHFLTKTAENKAKTLMKRVKISRITLQILKEKAEKLLLQENYDDATTYYYCLKELLPKNYSFPINYAISLFGKECHQKCFFQMKLLADQKLLNPIVYFYLAKSIYMMHLNRDKDEKTILPFDDAETYDLIVKNLHLCIELCNQTSSHLDLAEEAEQYILEINTQTRVGNYG